MFVERYLELSSELKYRKGESGAFMQLGELLTQKGDYETSTKHFYRAMKISEEISECKIKLAFAVGIKNPCLGVPRQEGKQDSMTPTET